MRRYLGVCRSIDPQSRDTQTGLLLVIALSSATLITTLPANAQNDTRYLPVVSKVQAGSRSTDLYAIKIPPHLDPDSLADQLGADNLGPVKNLEGEGYYLFRFNSKERNARSIRESLERKPEVLWFEKQVEKRRTLRTPSDPLQPDQWHLDNTGQSGGTADEDVNIIGAWADGYSGTGTTIAIVDDGVQTDHPDLALNYNEAGSLNPYPQSDDHRHGTAVAGIAAASADDGKCGVGAAFNAQIAAITTDHTDASEATALSHALRVNDIYNNSWGPQDGGTVLEGPGDITRTAMEKGITEGRNGLGSIYVWAAGNGRANNDDVNADGFANSRYTIAVGASDHNGAVSWYSEHGSAMLVNAPSSGGGVGTTTTDLMGAGGYNGHSDSDCTNRFGGTSSAAPLVSGIIALMLDANPALTWRDVQHILVETATRNHPTDPDWHQNGATYWVNHNYGFGRVDAGAATNLAATWVNVPPATTITSPISTVNRAIPDGLSGGGSGDSVIDSITIAERVEIEHVEVVFDADHSWRGDLRIELVSPDGTTSVMLHERENDKNDDFDSWRMMSTHYWGEESVGPWTLKITDTYGDYIGTWNSWQLILHGTMSQPDQPPLAVTLLAPSGKIADVTPTFSWKALPTATHYRLVVKDASGRKVSKWYTAAEAGCSTDTDTCSATPAIPLVYGKVAWWIKAKNSVGKGPLSKKFRFRLVKDTPRVAARLLAPAGAIVDTTPRFTWRGLPAATEYLLVVNDASGRKIRKWYPAAEAGCASGTLTCSVAPTIPLAYGKATWWITAKNGARKGPQSRKKRFKVINGGGDSLLRL